jgi:hypothetical protein
MLACACMRKAHDRLSSGNVSKARGWASVEQMFRGLTSNAGPCYAVAVPGAVLCTLGCIVRVGDDLVRVGGKADVTPRVLQRVGACAIGSQIRTSGAHTLSSTLCAHHSHMTSPACLPLERWEHAARA